MCGIAGFWTATSMTHDSAVQAAVQMANTIVHRGPDDSGICVDSSSGVAFAFRRLAIIDLTQAGHQPMESASGNFVVIFNGEIYNHLGLRRELELQGVRFRGRSDTEVLVEGFEQWGIWETISKADGMFAIAIWDRRKRTLYLVRDRMGIKPLYVYAEPGFVSFGSELKVLQAGPRFNRSLDDGALDQYLSVLYVPGPETIFKSTIKLQPGTIIEIQDPSLPLPKPVSYWSIVDIANNGRFGGKILDDAISPALVENTLSAAVCSHMESDVPLGAFLSGGIDSTLIVSMMQRNSLNRIRTFTVKFDDPVHDESIYAERIARHIGTEHTTIPVGAMEALDVVPTLANVFDEPFADSSQIPSLLVAAVARQFVTVALTGDGGDELFAGYNRYRFGRSAINRARFVPRVVRNAIGRLIELAPHGSIDRFAGVVESVMPIGNRQRLVEEKVRKLGRAIACESPARSYGSMVAVGAQDFRTHTTSAIESAFNYPSVHATLLDRMLLADQLSYLHDNQMTKIDRSSMAYGLESRVPFLDRAVVELSWRVSNESLIRGKVGKSILKQLLFKRVPQELLKRPKVGFSVPLASWLRGPLRPWAEELLADVRMANSPLDRNEVVQNWKCLQRGQNEYAHRMWAVLMFESWRACWL